SRPGGHPLPPAGADSYTLLQPVRAQVRTPFPGGNCNVNRVIRLGREADVPVSSHCDRANVGAIHQVVCNYDVLADAGEFVAAVWDRHTIDFRRIQEALHMIGQPEDFWPLRSLVHTYALEHRGSVMQRVRQDVNRGLLPRNHPAVHPDQFAALETHCSTPCDGDAIRCGRRSTSRGARTRSGPRSLASELRSRIRRFTSPMSDGGKVDIAAQRPSNVSAFAAAQYAVDHLEMCPAASLDDVGTGAVAAERLPLVIDHDRRFGLRILAARSAVKVEALQDRMDFGRQFQRAEYGFRGAVRRRGFFYLPVTIADE